MSVQLPTMKTRAKRNRFDDDCQLEQTKIIGDNCERLGKDQEDG